MIPSPFTCELWLMEHSPVNEHEHTTKGRRPIKRMLQGAVVDPFGHIWLVGKILE